MSKLITIDLRPTEKTLRQFGFIAFLAFGMLSLAAWHERMLFSSGLGSMRQPLTYTLLCIALATLTLGLVHPRANRPLYVGLSVVAYPIGHVVSYVVLAVLFYGVFGVVSVLMRLFGGDPMARGYDRRTSTYWAERRARPSTSSYFNQS